MIVEDIILNQFRKGYEKIETVFLQIEMYGPKLGTLRQNSIMWANIVKSKKPVQKGASWEVANYGQQVGAYWGDVEAYNEKEDGPYKEFLNESARKRAAVVKEVLTEEDLEAYAQRIRDEVIRKEENRERLRLEQEAEEQQRLEQAILCPCGCGRPPHQAPRPDFAGYCCGWCKKHNGKRGHGEGCGK
jgi:hypothetical protein